MDNKQILSKFIDSVVATDAEAQKEAISSFATNFVQNYLGLTPSTVTETFGEKITRIVEILDFDSPIRISKSGVVTVNGKTVGSAAEVPLEGQPKPDESGVVTYGEEHFDDASKQITGIQFTTLDGTFSKEFNYVQDFLTFIADKYGVK